MAARQAPLVKARKPGVRTPAPGHTQPSRGLDVFDNPAGERDYLIRIEVSEFTCLCPLTGQPDFASFLIEYIPALLCVELKSLKLYMWSYRDEGAFHERVTNQILDDLVAATAPRFMRVSARWNVRGGLFTSIVAEHRQKNWAPLPAVELAPDPSAGPQR